MAQIKLFSKAGLLTGEYSQIEFDGSVGEYIAENYFESGIPFTVYAGQPCKENDITFDEVRLLNSYSGEFVIVETPAEVATWIAVISLVISVVMIVLAPKPNIPANVNRQQESPNNSLSNRANQPRPLQRIPDIKGRVKSIPDVIQPTYKTYIGADVFEHGYYCVGRGDIGITNIKDGDTPLGLIEGSTAGVYAPYTSPNYGTPILTIGNFSPEPIIAAFRSNEVDGVDLVPETISGKTPIIRTTNVVPTPIGQTGMSIQNNSPLLFDVNVTRPSQPNWLSPDYYAGNYVILENFIITNDPFGTPTNYDISGRYKISSVIQVLPDIYTIRLEKGDLAWPAGNNLCNIGNSMRTEFYTPFNQWFYHTKTLFDAALVNITAPNGLYRDTGGASLSELVVQYQIEVQPIIEDGDDNWVDNGSAIIVQTSLTGKSQALRGITTNIALESQSSFKIRIKRTTPKFTGSGVVVDSTKIADLYGVVNFQGTDFGNVTTIQTLTIGNTSSTAVKERQLNCIATEKIYRYLGNGVFDLDLSLNIDENNNSSAVQSFIKDAIDPYIGGRELSEIDADGLLDLEDEIVNYFGTTDSIGFNYTWDSTEITFQEMAQSLFNAINCLAYREGTIISALFEKPKTIPAMLFTHRSKKPDSETYTRNFNKSKIYDGVVFNYSDPDTEKTETIYLPSDSVVNAKTFNIIGIRNANQALIRARREYNKIRYMKMDCALTVTAEGRYIKPNDMVAIVKGSRVKTYDGEVIAQSGLILTLSADVYFTADVYSITLKNDDGSTENIVCTAGATPDKVVLAYAPAQSIRTGIDQRRTEFSFGNDARNNAEKWLIQEIDIGDKWFVDIKGINYTDQYYSEDMASLGAFNNDFNNDFDIGE